jgi:hypothetical protein
LRSRCAAASTRASADPAAGREDRARLLPLDRLEPLVDRLRLLLVLERGDFAELLRARRVPPLELDLLALDLLELDLLELDLPEPDLLELDLPEPLLLEPELLEPPLLACGMLPPWINGLTCVHPTSRTHSGVGGLRALPHLISGRSLAALMVGRRTVCRPHLL